MYERVLQNTNAVVGQTFYEDGAAVDPGTVTVTVTDAQGAVLATDAATGGSGTSARTYTLTAATHTLLLDRLTLAWESATKGTLTSVVEVVGGFAFALAELSARLTDTTSDYTAAQMADARTYAEQFIEDRINIALVPRFGVYRGTASGTGFRIPRYGLRAIRWANTYTAGVATALTASELLALEADAGVVYGSWPSGLRAVEVGYEHGEDGPSPEAKEAALAVAAQRLVIGPVDDRATQRASEFGPVNLATPGLFGAYSGIPFVDEFINAHRIPAVA
jgi:hypothetical protein